MDAHHDHPPSLGERINQFVDRGVRLMTRLAIAFGLSTSTAIWIGMAVTDNAFVQIIVTIFAALAFWIPFAVLVARVERLFKRRRARRPVGSQPAPAVSAAVVPEGWRRLTAVAPGHHERLTAIRRSLEQSRLALGKADLDPDAHDLCVLIDRRLPELIDRELDTLAPDDRNRKRQIGELVDLIEQFARHCSRKRSGDTALESHEAAILRRRFEDHLTGRQGPDLLS
jgi:hypothetical protein